MFNKKLLGVGLAAMLLVPALALAQPGPGGGGQGGPGGGGFGGGNFDPAQFQQQILDNIKTQLGATDPEWQALQPKVQAVMTAQQEANSGRGRGGRGGPGGGPGGGGQGGGGPGGGGRGGQNANTELARAMTDLRDTLANEQSTPQQVSAKVQALRDARTRAAAKLADAQKSLKDLLTARQEAVMISMGYLE